MTDTMREALEKIRHIRDTLSEKPLTSGNIQICRSLAGQAYEALSTPQPIEREAVDLSPVQCARVLKALNQAVDHMTDWHNSDFCEDVEDVDAAIKEAEAAAGLLSETRSADELIATALHPTQPEPKQDVGRQWEVGQRVTKRKGSSWTGKVVGFYSTRLTHEGYAVESENEPGSVQIYPAQALSAIEGERK